MREVIVKSVIGGMTVRTMIGDQQAKPGDNHDASVQTRRVVNIPDSVTDHELLHIFELTCDCTGFGDRPRRYTFDYAELGAGKILK